MAKAEMNAFDVAALVHELQPLVGSRVDKVFQPAPGEVLVRLRTKASEDQGTKRDLWILVGKAVTLTRTARENPTEPPSFSMQLRRQLSGGRVAAVRQHHFDRVLEVDIERAEGGFTLVVELFHDGNVILVREGRILAALLQQSWATREVRPGAEFRHPPPRTMPSSLTYDEFRARLLASDADAVRTLATEFNLGGSYAEEVCALADVPKNTPTRELLEAQARALHDGIGRLVGRLERGELDPVVVWKDAARVDVAPWPLRAHDKPELRLERKATFAEALDTFYAAPGAPAAREDPAMKRFREEKGKAERQHAAQKAGLEKFEKEEAEARVKGDLLYGSFQEAQAAIAYVAALGRSLGWKDALARLVAAREEGRPEALVVESVLPKEAVAVLALPDASGAIRKVRVDFRKNLQENAQDQYDRAKKFRDKQVGARKALARSEAWLKDLGTKGARLEAKAVEKKDAPKASRRFWFDAFRWFRTSDGFFVVGGRDAGSNEKLVKKHLEENDRYVHADLHGAPSVVVKSAGRDIPESAIEEACAFAVGMSKAWGAGHAAGEAYWVLPSQVSKTPNPGEYVARGAFIVRGKRNYRTVSVRLAVGEVFLDPRVGEDAPGRRPGAIEVEGARKMMGGPDRAVAGQAKRYVVLEPGDEAANALAPRLAKAFGVPTEEIQAVLPPGGSRVVEVHGVELP